MPSLFLSARLFASEVKQRGESEMDGLIEWGAILHPQKNSDGPLVLISSLAEILPILLFSPKNRIQ